MNKDEIKKGLEYAARVTGNRVFASALNLITEQEKENEKLEQLNAIQCDAWQKLSDENESLATENSSYFRYNSVLRKENKRLKEEIKQAKIDVLNKLKERLDNAPNGWAYTTYIGELIEEAQNDRSNQTRKEKV